MKLCFLFGIFTSLLPATKASPYHINKPFNAAFSKRQISGAYNSSLIVDLGYEVYEGSADQRPGLNTWLGIRYAAPPTGQLRWQQPKAPAINRTQIIQATSLPQPCPQSQSAPLSTTNPGVSGDEDCLFLSVFAPPNATNLPVLVWIHGGGYGVGQGNQNLAGIISGNNNGFIGVAIQYRLGAFGFLSSDEVHRYGTPNAGLMDQTFALQWIQNYIALFGGNPSAVTISGQSAGGGSVMLQAMAFGGTLGDSLFSNAIAASPFLPMQYGYADFVPSQIYYAFAQAVGCFDDGAFTANQSVFQCLVGTDTATLQNASSYISGTGMYGTYGFLPVTDGVFLQQTPSQQLLKKQVNGVRMLSGNNANEGPEFTPQTIITEEDFVTFLQETFPLFSNDDIAEVLLYYPSTNASVDPNNPDFATSGISGATAVNESTFGSGQQQRADNVFAETTFVCPSYWLAEAFSDNGREAYKYQYSVIGAQHGSDVSAYTGPPSPNQSPDFETAFMTIWGNFIINNDPSIPLAIANGASSNDTTTPNPASAWPQFSVPAPYQVNLNETGGTPSSVSVFENIHNITEFEGPSLRNDFTLVNAYTWEGGRGARCDFWRSMGVLVPE